MTGAAVIFPSAINTLRPFTANRLRLYAIGWAILGLTFLTLHMHRATITGFTGHTVAFGDDFINVWSAARLALTGQVATIYDFARFVYFESASLGGPLRLYYYSYPPVTVLLTLPFGELPYLPALALWFAGGLAVFVATIATAWPWRRRWSDILLYAIALPAVLINALAGQTGTWTAAAFAGGLMALERAPIAGGLLLGLLVVKPQMALLVPVALLAGRQWIALLACATTAVALIALSLLLFGTDAWLAFLQRIPLLRAWDLEDGTGIWHFYASVFVAVRHLPASLPVAYAVQGFASIAALLLVVTGWLSSAPTGVKHAILVLGAVFVTPYIQAYDLVVLSLVPLWLLGCEPAEIDRQRMLWAAVPLTLAPIASPILALLVGVNLAPWLLLPMLWIVARAAMSSAFDPGQRQIVAVEAD